MNALLKKREALVKSIKLVDKEIKAAMKLRLKSVSKKNPTLRGRRRTFKNLRVVITELLEKAGKKGIRVADLATKLKLSTNNVYSWFYTTGAKNRKIKKVAPGTFALLK